MMLCHVCHRPAVELCLGCNEYVCAEHGFAVVSGEHPAWVHDPAAVEAHDAEGPLAPWASHVTDY